MKNDPMVRGALAVSLLSLACTPGDVVQHDSTKADPPPEAGTESGSPEPDPEPGPPEPPEEGGAP